MNDNTPFHRRAHPGSPRRRPRRNAAALLAALSLAFTTGATGQSPVAGMPMETHLLLKSVEVVGCEPLDQHNAGKVTRVIAERAEPDRAKRIATDIARRHAGSVVEVRVLHERTVTFSLIRPSDEPTADTGWERIGEETPTRVFFVPESAEAGCEALTPGSRWSLTQDPRIDCDTAPPVGLCVFDAVALPTREQMRQRYGEPENAPAGATGEATAEPETGKRAGNANLR